MVDEPKNSNRDGASSAGRSDAARRTGRPNDTSLDSDSSSKPAKRNWIQEERRRTLGDWVAFCLACGHTQRYFEDDEALLPAACVSCGGEMRHRCPACDARLPSAFQVACEECGAELRPNELLGMQIRRPAR